MVNNFAARKAVEKTRSGKVKNRLSHLAWKSRQHPRDSHFPTASAASVSMTNSYRTEGDISNEVSWGTFLKRYDIHSLLACILSASGLHFCHFLHDPFAAGSQDRRRTSRHRRPSGLLEGNCQFSEEGSSNCPEMGERARIARPSLPGRQVWRGLRL